MRLSPVVLLALIGQLHVAVAWAQPGSQSAPPATAGSAAPAPTQAPSADSNPPTPPSAPAAEPSAPAAAPSAPAAVSGEAPKAEATPAASTTSTTPAAEPAPDLTVPSPGELSDRLVGDLAPAPEQKTGWTAPTPIVTLHGYLRVRGELMDRFWLNRPIPSKEDIARGGPDPFTAFRPLEHGSNQTACANEETATETLAGTPSSVCKVKTLQFASMRFRFSPQLNISEDIRIKSTFDILDNYVLGTAPQGYYGSGPGLTGQAAQTFFAGTDIPVSQLILPRRVWAEVRNRDLGELRFGLMPDHWGLGMLYNAGNGLDDDYSTDLGRVMGTTKLLGFYLSASYDFLSEGRLSGGYDRPPYDASQLDDLDQFTASVVRRFPDEDEETVLARGEMVLNGGARFQFRHQDSLIDQTVDKMTGLPVGQPMFRNLNATVYTPDVWGQLKYGKLRLELEAAWVVGHMLNPSSQARQHISQIGAAFEGELRLLNDKLGVYFYSGFASGDSETEGLSNDSNYIDHAGTATGAAGTELNNSLISTFRFSPAYRVDLILWRTLMRQITGAYYFKPGLSYDFVKDSFGQLFGARVDAIWSRASAPVQTWGNSENLGVELDAQVYWRSADGPNQNDGYHAMLQYGVLFPMKGLGMVNAHTNLLTAQTVRLVLGVVF